MAALEKITDDRRTHTVTLKELRQKIVTFGELLDQTPINAEKWSLLWQELKIKSDTLVDIVRSFSNERKDDSENELLPWALMLRDDVFSHYRDVDNLVPWIHFAGSLAVLSEAENQNQPSLLIWKCLSLDTHLGEMGSCYRGVINELETISSETLRIR